MKTYGFVFARGGSKGVPGKNIRPMAGKPLLLHALDVARAVPAISRCFISTDDTNIAEVAKKGGATVIDRPASLALDNSPEWLAWQHAIHWVQEQVGSFERFVSLPATAPLRSPPDVEACLQTLDDQTDVVITVTESHRSPWFNMVRLEANGELGLLVQDGNSYVRRQDAPRGYDMTTLAYVSRPAFILTHQRIWDGRVRGVIIPAERAIDIDTPLDFKIADFLLRERLQLEHGPC